MIKIYYENTLKYCFFLLTIFFSNISIAQLPFEESFKNSTAPGMVFGGNPLPAILTSGGDDPAGDGFLRLTNNDNNQTGFAYNNDIVLPGVGLNIEFEYYQYGGTGADGITFFLFDATADPFQIGGFGGSLGYAQRFAAPGVSKAYIGIAYDVFGNFTAPTEGRQGGPGRLTNNISIRGAGDGDAQVPDNYPYLTHVRLSAAPFSFNVGSGASRVTDTTNVNFRKTMIRLKPRAAGGYFIDVDIVRGGSPTVVHNVIQDFEYMKNAPASLKFGFSAGTGGSTNFHEIRNFKATVFDSTVLDPPVLEDDFAGTCINEAVNIDFETNDLTFGPVENFINKNSIDLDTLTAGTQQSVTIPGEGTFEYDPVTETLTFTPEVGFTGTSSIGYNVKDGYGVEAENGATITVTVSAAGCVDLRVTKSVSNSSPNDLDNIVFTIIVSNLGPNDATGVEVDDLIPDGYNYVSDNGGGDYDDATGIWTIGNLDNGNNVSLEITVQFTECNPCNHLNTAIVSATEDDPNPNNDTSRVRPIDIQVDISVDEANPPVGTFVNFTIEVTNNSLDLNATNVQVINNLPTGYTYYFDDGGVETVVSGNNLTWNAGFLAAGASKTIIVTAIVLDAGVYLNESTVTMNNPNLIDTVSSNNSSSVTITPFTRAAYTCETDGFFTSGSNTEARVLDFDAGTFTAPTSLTTGIINAVGYNITDDYLWGYHTGQNRLARISDGFDVDLYQIPGLPEVNYVAGDVDAGGVLWLFEESSTVMRRVDVNPASANYLKRLSDVTVPQMNTQDFAFNNADGQIYGLRVSGGNFRTLYTLNPTTGERSNLGVLTGGLPNSSYEGAYLDASERLLFSNTGGEVWGLVNFTSGNLEAEKIMDGPTSNSGEGDACFCQTASFNIVLPVKWLNFTARKVDDFVLLNWSTASEVNNDYFEIQRSINGLDFVSIAKVKGSGNSNTIVHYEYRDTIPSLGYNYYRIKQVDYDAAFEFSETQVVNFQKEIFNLNVFPNPFSNFIIIETGDENAIGPIVIRDATGRTIYEENIFESICKIDLSMLDKGLYFLVYDNDKTKKIIKN